MLHNIAQRRLRNITAATFDAAGILDIADYTWQEWTFLSIEVLIILLLFAWYFLYLDPKDPSGIYKNPKLQLNSENDEIRILILEPGEWNDPIKCRLDKVGLRTDPQFLALSYAWVEKFPLEIDRELKTVFDYTEHFYRAMSNWLERRQYKTLLKRMRMVFGDRRKQIIFVNGRKAEVGINLELALRHLRVNAVGVGDIDPSSITHGTTQKGEIAIWADAVCINQDDVLDRNKQVSSMREVYKKAQRVEIWLGAERDFHFDDDQPSKPDKSRLKSVIADNPRGGIDRIWSPTSTLDVDEKIVATEQLNKEDEFYVETTKQKWEDFHNKPKLLRAERPDYTREFFCMIHLLQREAFRHCHSPEERLPLDDRIPFLKQASARAHVLEVFKEIMDRLWWNRLWVVQETVIAQQVDVRYGRFVIPWDNLVLAAKNFQTHRFKECCVAGWEILPTEDVDVIARFADTVTGLEIWRKGWTKDAENTETKIRLLRLLWQFRDRKTSEPRDKVYALLPLVTDSGRGNQNHKVVQPRYEWTVAGVYVNVVSSLLEVEQSLLVLAGNAKKSKQLAGLPSWAPDWSEPPLHGEIKRLERMTLYNASAKKTLSSKDWRVLGTNEYLELKGIEQSVVEEVADEVMVPEVDAASYAKTLRTFQAWEKLAKVCDHGNADDEYQNCGYTRDTAYFKTIAMDTKYVGKVLDTSKVEVNRLDFKLADKDFGVGLRNWEQYLERHLGVGRPVSKVFNSTPRKPTMQGVGRKIVNVGRLKASQHGRRSSIRSDGENTAPSSPSPQPKVVAFDSPLKKVTQYDKQPEDQAQQSEINTSCCSDDEELCQTIDLPDAAPNGLSLVTPRCEAEEQVPLAATAKVQEDEVRDVRSSTATKINDQLEERQDLVVRRLERQNTPQSNLATEINTTVESATVDRRFFMTSTGHMGLGPPNTQRGDRVFVLRGGQVPFILREAGKRTIPRNDPALDGNERLRSRSTDLPRAQTAAGGATAARADSNAEAIDPPQQPLTRTSTLFPWGSTYRHRNSGEGDTECFNLVGDCYVQGIMQGEAYDEEKLKFVYLV